MLKNFSIRTKLFTVVGVLAALAAGLTALSLNKLKGIDDQLNEIVDVTSQKALLSANINEDLVRINRAEKNHIMATKDEEMDLYEKRIADRKTVMSDRLKKLENLSNEEEKKQLAEFQKAFGEYEAIFSQVRDNSRKGTNNLAGSLSRGKEHVAQFEAAEKALDNFFEKVAKSTDEQYQNLHQLKNQRVEDALKVSEANAKRLEQLAVCREALPHLARHEKNLILATEDAEMDKFAKLYEAKKNTILTSLSELEKTASGDEKKEIAAALRAVNDYSEMNKKIEKLSRENTCEVARVLSCTKGQDAIDKAQKAMESIAEGANKSMAADKEASAEAYAAAKWMMYSVSAIGIIAAIGLAFLVVTGIVNAIRKAVEVITAFASGDYSKHLEIDGKDEIAVMAVSLNKAIDATGDAMNKIKEAAERDRQAQIEADRKVKHILEVANKVGQKDYTKSVEVTGEDALGQLGNGLRKFFADKQETERREEEKAAEERTAAEVLRRKVDGLLNVVSAAAQGDLTKQVRVEGDEPVDELAGGIKKMLEDLSGVIGQVTDSAMQFNEGSRIIAESSQTLAQGAQTQSSSVEEMTASIEELERSIQAVKENATEANRVASDANRLAEEGGKAVQKSVESMSQIRESSQKISEIIQVISEIASQTNLLALNAAIEAARAGEHGMGFAVVADEVRKLAERSNQAAREISTLIKESTQTVEQGVQLSDETGKSLTQIIEAVQTTAAKIAEIAEATVEQAAGAHEVSKAIQSVAHVTETSAAGSEELASSSEELGAQSVALKDLVSRFQTSK